MVDKIQEIMHNIIKVVRPLDEAQNTIIKYIKVKELNKLKKQYTAQKK